jgi:hypothetical protein
MTRIVELQLVQMMMKLVAVEQRPLATCSASSISGWQSESLQS